MGWEKMKSFRNFVEELERDGTMKVVERKVSQKLEAAAVLKKAGEMPVKFNRIEGCKMKAVGNVFATRELVARYLGIGRQDIIAELARAINKPSEPEEVSRKEAPVLENTLTEPDLNIMPMLTHAEKDGGPYIASAIVIANDPEYGRNCSFHRMMQIGKDKLAIRILPRHLNAFIERAGGTLDVAFIIGAPINVMLASATSVELGMDELTIANSLAPLRTVALDNGISVPADAEIAVEATITSEMHDEGPFVDLTETYDIVRKQRVIKIKKIHHRNNPLFHALLPGGFEHKILMGMPREPTIFNEVSKVCECTGVNITPGGCSWLHAVVSIRKKKEDDGKKAIDAAFEGHKSLKHVVVVDEDINIYDPLDVEWAIATRVQGDKDIVIKLNQKGSSLDPSADPHTYETCKVGVDATKPLIAHGKNFAKARFRDLNLDEYLKKEKVD
jgi:2,5-furandicarboxylate decarboxylase 1